MGARLSTTQKDVFYQVVGVLRVAGVKFSKGELKRFIKLLFLHFPKTTPEYVSSVLFWSNICTKFDNLARSGDTKVMKFIFWPQQMKAALLRMKGVEKRHSSLEVVSPVRVLFPLLPSPLVPQ